MKIQRGHIAIFAAVLVFLFLGTLYWPSSVKAQGPAQGSIYWNPLQSSVSGCGWPAGVTTTGITFAVSYCPVGTGASHQIYAAYNGSPNFAPLIAPPQAGPPGPQGIPGPQGPQGSTGAQGPAGTIPTKICGALGPGNGGQLVFNTAACL